MLYTISKPNSLKQNFIFGTIHLGGKNTVEIAEKVKPYIDRSSKFYGEMDISQLVDNFYQAFKLPAGTSISDLYTSRKFDKLNNFSIKYFGLDLHSTADIKPLFILAKYSEIISNHSGKALDAILFEYALLRNLPVSGLETVVRQMEIAELIPLDMQVKMLSSALKNIKSFKRNHKKQINDYYLYNVLALYKKSKKNLGGIRKLMLYDRNYAMADKVITILQHDSENSHFFCFGAAHLEGGKGVLSYLKKEGYKVKIEKNWKSKT